MRDLEKDLAICEAATPGPWDDVADIVHSGNSCGDEYNCGIECKEADARFITESRTGWPEAIKRAKAAMAEVKRLKEALAGCDELFAVIRNDFSDPRYQCRRGRELIECALKAGDPV